MNIKKIFILLIFCILSAISSGYAKDVYLIYKIKSGDSFFGIAKKNNISLNELVKMNPKVNPNAIKSGDDIKIPINNKKIPVKTVKRKSFRIILGGDSLKFKKSLLFPLKNYRKISSIFGYRWHSFHEGIDISAPKNTNIYASHKGKVVYSANRMSGYGNTIVIQGDGVMTVYAHNNRNLVSVGDIVKAGERIGLVGDTGRTRGAHLHFETRVKVNNMWYAVQPSFFF